MRNIKLLPMVLIIILVTISGCVNSNTGNTSLVKIGKYGDLELTMELEKTTFIEDEDINVMVTFKNNGDQPITIKGVNVFDLGIISPEGEFTYLNPGGSIDDEETLATIDPGKSITEEINWDQTYLTPDGEETIVDPGEYKLGVHVKAIIEIKQKGNNIDIEPYTLKTDNITINIE